MRGSKTNANSTAAAPLSVRCGGRSTQLWADLVDIIPPRILKAQYGCFRGAMGRYPSPARIGASAAGRQPLPPQWSRSRRRSAYPQRGTLVGVTLLRLMTYNILRGGRHRDALRQV